MTKVKRLRSIMDCREFENNIRSFIKDQLPDEKYYSFIEHYDKCSECKEELEILYLVHRTINVDDPDNFSFNLKEQLEKHIKEVEDKVYRRYKRRFLRNVSIILAELTTCTAMVVFILIMSGII